MSTPITLQAALTVPAFKTLSFPFTIGGGVVLTFDDADSLDAVAEMLWQISPAAMVANINQLQRVITASGLPGITDGNQVLVTYGPGGARKYHPYEVSSSPSRSPSLSPSASLSRSPSLSASLSPSASLSRSPSLSPSAS